jgi:hypothetical protein
MGEKSTGIHKNWRDLHYLTTGTPTQRAAYAVMMQSELLEHLRDYSPTLVGTIPLNIDIPGSDLDILCEAVNFTSFSTLLRKFYTHLPGFEQKTKILNGAPSHISRFVWELKGTSESASELLRNTGIAIRFPIEIVAQSIPVTQQRAYRHMLAEARLLERDGEPAQQAIRQLKLSGLKTEPAFAKYFNLQGDPYLAILDLIGNETRL